MKKITALLLVLALSLCTLTACGNNKASGSTAASGAETSAAASAGSTAASAAEVTANATGAGWATIDNAMPADWGEYDSLIDEIRTSADTTKRAELMHQAEDMLMDSGCIVPLYYYNDIYMMKDYVDGVFGTIYGTKYFKYGSLTNGSDALNVCLASEPDYLDPALNSSVDGAALAANSFEGLMTYVDTNKVDMACADSYELSDDGLTYTFTLRDDLKWSNGEKLDASDFEYAWKRAANPDTAADYAYLFDVFATTDDGTIDVTASDDGKTLTAVLAAPCPYFLDLCAFPAFMPVYQETVEKNNPDGTNPGAWALEANDNFVCNGAYVLTSWEHDASMTYEKNPNYYAADSVKIDKVNYMLSADATTYYAAYQSGNLDFIEDVPTDEIAGLLSSGNKEFYVVDQLGTYYMIFNVKSDLYSSLGLDDEQAKTFRKAICLLIDRDYIVSEVTQVGQTPATTYIPEECPDGNGGVFKTKDYFTVDDYDANVQAAISMLESIGFKFDGGVLSSETPITFEYLTNDATVNITIAEAMQADLAAVGVTMNIVQEEWNVFLDDRKAGNYNVARNGWVMDFGDPINMLEMWTTASGNNDAQFGR